MKSIPSLSFLLFVALTGCQRHTSSENPVDSTAVTTDTLPQDATSTTYTPVDASPIIAYNFPSYVTELYSEDPMEAKVMDVLGPLLDKYDIMPLLKITRSYSRSYEEEMDVEDTMEATEGETATWYYDSTNHLKAYAKNTWYEIGQSGRASSTTIYLYAGDSLIAEYKDQMESVQDSYEIKRRALLSMCPACGVQLSTGMNSGDTFSASVLEYSNLDNFDTNRQSDRAMLDIDISGMPLANALIGTDYVFDGQYSESKYVNQDIVTTTYDVRYKIDKYLFDHFMQGEGD